VNTFKTASLALLFALGFSARAAHAQEWTRQSFLLPKGGFEITGEPARPVLMRINMSKDSAFKPVTFPVDFFWGVTDDVMIGITHETGPRFNTGAQNPKLRDTYNDVGFGSVFWLAGGANYEVDLHAGVPFHQLSPDLWVGATIGVLGRANFARNVALVYDPGLYFGLNHHDEGNTNGIYLPFWFYFQATDTIVPFVGSGVKGPLDKFGDNFSIPLEGGVLFNVGRGINIGADLEFPNAFGHNGTLDARNIGFMAQFRF
jgi:hypothetical protein